MVDVILLIIFTIILLIGVNLLNTLANEYITYILALLSELGNFCLHFFLVKLHNLFYLQVFFRSQMVTVYLYHSKETLFLSTVLNHLYLKTILKKGEVNSYMKKV